MLKTDFNKKENGSTRYTHKFEIYSFEEIESFKKMIAYAMRMNVYSSKIFELLKNSSIE